jgi:hypothetical protein
MGRRLTPFLLVVALVASSAASARLKPANLRQSPQVNTSLPSISGTPVQGQILSASTGAWSGPTATYSEQWMRCDSVGSSCLAIVGATTLKYTLVAADVGATLRVSVTSHNRYGSTVATSKATLVIAPTSSSTTTTEPTTSTPTTPTTTTTTPAPAPTPPSASLSAAGLDSAHIALGWTATAGASSYKVYRGGLLIGTTSATSFTDALLWPETSYDYTVTALNDAGSVIVSSSLSAKTQPLPTEGFPRPFAASSFWNTPITSAPSLSSSNQTLVQYLAAHANNPNLALHSWGVAVAEAHPSDTRYTVPCTSGWSCTLDDLGPFGIPLTAKPDPSGDGHLAIYDPVSKNEWDMWRAACCWSASAGSSESMLGAGTIKGGTASGDAANLPLLGGVIRPEEILQGHIDHALVFGVPGIGQGAPVCPATHNAPTTSDPTAPREGQKFQLDPTIDVGSLSIPSWEKTVARAMQVYGMYLRDNGGTLGLYGENPISRGYDAWANVGLGGMGSAPLAGIPWARVRALDAPDYPNC